MMQFLEVVKHIKTGRKYCVLYRGVIECTNGREDKRYVVYYGDGPVIFCREEKEFDEKFKRII